MQFFFLKGGCHFCLVIIIRIREKFWDFIANNFDIELEVELHNLNDIDFVYTLFGVNLNFFSESANDHFF